MKSLFSEKEIKSLKKYLKTKNLLSEQGIGRRLADALENADSAIIKSIKNIDPKIATNFLETEINTFDDLVKHLTIYKSIWSSINKFDWKFVDESIRFLNKSSKSGFIKQIPEDEMLQFINDLPTDGDLRGIVFDLWQESKGVSVKPKKTDVKTKVVKNNNGDNVVVKTKTDGTEETFNIDNNGELKEIDPKDLEKVEPKQVAGVKLDDIPKDEFDIIDASLKKYGLDKDWGYDANTGEPVYVTLNINGENVKFTLNKQGPEQFDLHKISEDKLEEKFKDEYDNTLPPDESGNKPYIMDWIKQEKILKDPDLRKKYVYRYNVPLGVRMYADDVKGNWGQWVIINPEAISNYRKPKNLEELKNSIFHVIYHELTHVVQKVSNQSYASYKSGGFQNGKEAWGYLTGKRSKYYYKNQVIPGEKPSVNFWDWWHSDENNVETLIRKFGAEKNIDTSKDYSWRDDFDEWALQNNEVPEKFIIQPKKQTVSNSNIINMYGDDVKSRVLRYKIDYWKNVSDEYAKIKTKTDGLSDEKLLKFIDNNIGIEEIDNIVKYAAQELSYFSHVKEIEAEFSANIKNLMELGTLEKNKGFATFLVDYLRGTNKSQKLADINIKKHNYDFNLELDAKYPNTKNINDVNTNKLKEFFKKFIDLFLKKNVTNEIKLEKELKSVDGWVNNIPKDFFEVLSKLENEWKTIYPDQAKQLEKGLYKQAYELISKGYPALLPFIITGLDDTEEENKEEVKNESFLMKKNFLSEKEKKGLKTYLKKELLIKNKFF
jgi:hypothetical protein